MLNDKIYSVAGVFFILGYCIYGDVKDPILENIRFVECCMFVMKVSSKLFIYNEKRVLRH